MSTRISELVGCCDEALTMAENLRRATGDAIPGAVCSTLKAAKAKAEAVQKQQADLAKQLGKLAVFLQEAHEPEIAENHGGDVGECSYCAAIARAHWLINSVTQ